LTRVLEIGFRPCVPVLEKDVPNGEEMACVILSEDYRNSKF
jgi:hypothetical protein